MKREKRRRYEVDKKYVLGKYLDYEAELGADNEDNDDVIKEINVSDEWENEDSQNDMSEDMRDFVDTEN